MLMEKVCASEMERKLIITNRCILLRKKYQGNYIYIHICEVLFEFNFCHSNSISMARIFKVRRNILKNVELLINIKC